MCWSVHKARLVVVYQLTARLVVADQVTARLVVVGEKTLKAGG